jgi:3-oxoadipate enol-lactonase
MERLTRFLARRLFPHEHQRELRQQMAERYSHNDRRAYLAALHALAGWSVEDIVDQVQLPTLVLAGEYDVAPLADSRAFARSMPQAELKVVADSGHATPYDQHNVVNDLVIDFLNTTRWGTDRRVSTNRSPGVRSLPGEHPARPGSRD